MTWRVLDLDGPILAGKQRHYACYRDGMQAVGKTPMEIEAYWAHKRDQLVAADTSDEAFKAFWLSHIEEPEYLALDRLQSGAAEILKKWCDAGDQLVLVTMRQHESRVIEQLKSFGIYDYFSSVIVTQKPEKEAALSGIDPKQAIWIGDTEVDAQSAQRFGCPCYLVENGLREGAFLAQFAGCTVVPDITVVP